MAKSAGPGQQNPRAQDGPSYHLDHINAMLGVADTSTRFSDFGSLHAVLGPMRPRLNAKSYCPTSLKLQKTSGPQMVPCS